MTEEEIKTILSPTEQNIKNLYPVEMEPMYLLVPNTDTDICNMETFKKMTNILFDERISLKQQKINLHDEEKD